MAASDRLEIGDPIDRDELLELRMPAAMDRLEAVIDSCGFVAGLVSASVSVPTTRQPGPGDLRGTSGRGEA